MLYGVIKALLSGALVGLVSETARRNAALGALFASLPLVSVLGMIWLWRDTRDVNRLADHAQATFWYVIPSLPMFLLIPALLRRGVGFWPALLAGCALTVVLYGVTVAVAARVGVRL
ncbi:DUF3147 family protein [Brevundimonas sp. TWP2-3-4b2]|uniref:DUF3147 family protein n=1 Tax=Brevundimonas sp. TWP2-3-4b2 TaxID=2804595 RepID=UPI003CF598A5